MTQPNKGLNPSNPLLEEMASGSYEIDTFSWYKSFPLSNLANGFSTGTLFAVGECGFMSPFSFYQYTSTVGFPDTSTMSVNFTNYVCTSLQSTTGSLLSTIGSNLRGYTSTIPLTRWISASITRTEPFTYPSSFFVAQSTCGSTITSTINNQFQSTGFFGYSTINAYANCPISCPPYTYPSTIPILVSTFTSTTISSITSNFISIGQFGYATSNLTAPSFLFDFRSTYTGTSVTLPYTMRSSNLYLGDEMTTLMNSRNYNVWVEAQYSLYLYNAADNFYWISTTGVFNEVDGINKGRTVVNRGGLSNYFEIYDKWMFNPAKAGEQSNMPPNISSFHLELSFFSTGSVLNNTMPKYDIFIPGQNNFTFTLVPVTSTILD